MHPLQIKDQETAALFLGLAKEEEQHISDFETFFQKLSDYQPMEDHASEYMEYVKDLVDDHVFSQRIDIDQLAKRKRLFSTAMRELSKI